MRVLVTGSRKWTDDHLIRSRLRQLPRDSFVMMGDASGVDFGARSACTRDEIDFAVYHARWNVEGRRAGILRNLRMLDQRPDLVLAFWDGVSPGTRHTIDEAHKRGIPVEVHEERKP